VDPVKPWRPQQTTQNPATELAVRPKKPQSMRPGGSGVTPPVEHRFKPGQDWRGNAGGRSKILREESAAYLNEKDKGGKTNARRLIESMATKALSSRKDAVSAFKALRETIDPKGSNDEADKDGPVDWDLVKHLMELMVRRKADAIEEQANAQGL